MQISETKKGDLAILTKSLLSGLFPVVVTLSYSHLGPLYSLAFSSLFAAGFLAILLTAQRKWGELSDKSVWPDLLRITFIIGIVFYSLYYYGLRYSNPGNVSLIGLLETFFSFLLFNVWRKESFSFQHLLGAGLVILGAAVVLLPKADSWHAGNLFIILAVAIAPFGNFLQQRVRKKISSETILFVRNLLALPFVFFLAYLFSENFSLSGVKNSIWLLLTSGVLVLGFSKILWIEGIHRISVTKAAALSALSPVFALIFSFWFLHQTPTVWQLGAFAPLFVGLLLLTYNRPDPGRFY